jgi:hypothetical protein
MPTVEEASRGHLAGVLEGYLRQEKWATERRLEGDVYKSHNVEELRQVLESDDFSYLRSINPQRLEQVRKKFLSGNKASEGVEA